jgi:hypothetical protein
MRATVNDILAEVAANVDDSGICATTAEGQVDSQGALWEWPIPVCGGCFSLPEDCLEARQIFINGFGTIQRDRYWQGQLRSGQNTCGTQCCWSEVIDLGDFSIPTPFPNIRPIYLSFSAESNADAGKEITIEIVNQYGQRRRETLTLLNEMQQVQMDEAAVDVTFFGKPQTEGNVRAYLNYATGQRFHLCDYGPKVQVGQFRRKKLPQWCPYGTNLIRVLGKMRFRKITSISDIIPISDISALSWALSAVSAQERKDPQGYNDMLTLAVNELWKSIEDGDSPSNVHAITFLMGGCAASQSTNSKPFN